MRLNTPFNALRNATSDIWRMHDFNYQLPKDQRQDYMYYYTKEKSYMFDDLEIALYLMIYPFGAHLMHFPKKAF